jgi:hypothetical protein
MHARPYADPGPAHVVGISQFVRFLKEFLQGCVLRVFLDYAHPRSGMSRWMGALQGASYARWCTRRMVREAR